MHPQLTPDQRLLAQTTERFIADRMPLSRVRELVDSGDSASEAYWRAAGEIGWFAMLAPEELGGGSVSGRGLLDAAILAELRGRHLQPGAFVDTNVCVSALARNGSDEQQAKVLPALLAGEQSVAWALSSIDGDISGACGLTVIRSRDGFRLNGQRTLVLGASSASWLLVTASGDEESLAQLLVPADAPGVSVEPLSSFDLTRRPCRVTFRDVEVDHSCRLGTEQTPAAEHEHSRLVGTVLAAAETAGAMQAVFDLVVAYAKDRIAFGRPIGSFQAVKHGLADTSLAIELSHAVVSGAVEAIEENSPEAPHAASMAKALVGDAAVEVAHVCWQYFGGIAYTWEHDFHLYLRRLTSDAALYGSPTWHRERTCQLVGL
jgi:alkylation response protein AidB-like acyl-CoA dehydrogenase